MILTADFHLTDRPADEYRWQAFHALHNLLEQVGSVPVCILGDLTDKRNNHSAELVNRLDHALSKLSLIAEGVHILMGNHDAPLNGPPFWTILNNIVPDVFYYSKPALVDNIAFLPFTRDPVRDWKIPGIENVKVAFMHQPVSGARTESGLELKEYPLPKFPKNMRIYSGDIHTPQRVGQIEYVGAPHHIKFGDNYTCRMLVIDPNDYSILHEEILQTQEKLLLEGTAADIRNAKVKPGDMVKLRVTVQDIEAWPEQERQLHEWAEQAGVNIGSLEAVVPNERNAGTFQPEGSPEEVFDAFVEHEKLDKARIAMGRQLLQKATNQP